MSVPLCPRWMEAVLGDELPPTTELEESLRHGVHLARLALRLRPDPGRRVYDPELTRYAARGLQFRHTDNINVWTQTMQEMGLPQVRHRRVLTEIDPKDDEVCIFL